MTVETIAKLNLGNVGQENMPDLLLAGIFPYDFLLVPELPLGCGLGSSIFLKNGELELAAAGSQSGGWEPAQPHTLRNLIFAF